MQRLEDSELSRSPSEVFEIICKLGKGSYGSVFKARYKANGCIVAVKKVPVDSDLTDIVKEISIMQQCDSPFIVKCYGSLFDSQDLWICMEYCGAGSIADIMRLRGKTLGEDEIATVLHYSLRGLDYLHQMRKIHRDIKAGNILLLNSGTAKLADFGVAGQLSDTLAKRNTVIGTPYWMAPEVIQEIGYNYSADIWSLGITAIEMADGKPPLADIHPMRALFMIPSQPSPTLRKPSSWSAEFRAFVAACLAKTPESRPTAAALLQTEFIRSAKSCSILLPLIDEAAAAREKRLAESKASILAFSEPVDANADKEAGSKYGKPPVGQTDTNENGGTIRRQNSKDKDDRKILDHDGGATLISLNSDDSGGSRVFGSKHLLNRDVDSLSGKSRSSAEDDLGTMVINASEDEEDSGSVVVHETSDAGTLDTNERERNEAFELLDAALPAPTGAEGTLTRKANAGEFSHENNDGALGGQQRDNVQMGAIGNSPVPPMVQRPFAPFSRALQQSGLFPGGPGNEPGALNRLSYPELQQLLATLTNDLETELRNLAVRYRHKRQPLLDAIAEKTAQATEAHRRGSVDSLQMKQNPSTTSV
ncbi:unnamed protein product [Calicophoron daubneyi]|uniref:Serine/threonine-protein kinase cst-1 n=1 Tax=Calicophoron daubneyi TaxID=300641 RepID=A0AAV2TKR1_CALDB